MHFSGWDGKEKGVGEVSEVKDLTLPSCNHGVQGGGRAAVQLHAARSCKRQGFAMVPCFHLRDPDKKKNVLCVLLE